MTDPNTPAKRHYPETPAVDERANKRFLDTIFDTDGRPDSEAVAVVETEGLDDDEERDR